MLILDTLLIFLCILAYLLIGDRITSMFSKLGVFSSISKNWIIILLCETLLLVFWPIFLFTVVIAGMISWIFLAIETILYQIKQKRK